MLDLAENIFHVRHLIFELLDDARNTSRHTANVVDVLIVSLDNVNELIALTLQYLIFLVDRTDDLVDDTRDRHDIARDDLSMSLRLLGKLSDFLGDDAEPASLLTCSGCFNRSIEGDQVCLPCDIVTGPVIAMIFSVASLRDSTSFFTAVNLSML